jgi:hypothetical protein
MPALPRLRVRWGRNLRREALKRLWSGIGETDRHISDKRGKLESCPTIDQKDSHEIDLGYCDRRLRGV